MCTESRYACLWLPPKIRAQSGILLQHSFYGNPNSAQSLQLRGAAVVSENVTPNLPCCKSMFDSAPIWAHNKRDIELDSFKTWAYNSYFRCHLPHKSWHCSGKKQNSSVDWSVHCSVGDKGTWEFWPHEQFALLTGDVQYISFWQVSR